MIKFKDKEYINLNNKSSEWISIELPAQTHLFIDYAGDFMYPLHYKIISNKFGILWRVSHLKGNWVDVNKSLVGTNKTELENIYKKYLYKLRENKLKRILNFKEL